MNQINKITKITRRDIIEILKKVEGSNFTDYEEYLYPYYGRLKEVDFLKRLYNLKEMESMDSRQKNAEDDISCHIYFGDYGIGWIFEDERFDLIGCSDEEFLKFICEIFHPEVRDENKDWKQILNSINKLLKNDGIKLYVKDKISNRNIYAWKVIQIKNKGFLPFSQRYAKEIRNNEFKVTIKENTRYQIYKVLEKFNEIEGYQTNTGYNYLKNTYENIYEDIEQYYIPKYYDESQNFIEIKKRYDLDVFKEFIMHTRPVWIFDVIEFFIEYVDEEKFTGEINKILKLNELDYRMKDGQIYFSNEFLKIVKEEKNSDMEVEELIKESREFYTKGDYYNATLKIWDAFENMKSNYQDISDKKKSVNKLIKDISCDNKNMEEEFQKEFKNLTDIGNKFKIRHHEKNAYKITDERHYEYFYKRCLAVITTVNDFLDLN